MCLRLLATFPEWKPHFSFLANAAANELMALRWLHFIFGIIWIGLLYFFNLVLTPSMKALEPGVRMKVYPVLMSRAMTWFRWSALVTVVVGMRYFFSLLITDARNSGDSGLVRAVGIGALVIAASWMVMALNGGEHVSSGHLAIGVGGGLGFIMLL